jgi:hypothetical protein
VTERRSMFIGLAAASAVPPLDPEVDRATEAVAFVGAAFLLALPFSLLATLIVGLPSVLLCRRLGLVRWWLALGVGALTGVLVAVVRPANQPIADVIVKYVLLGAVAGLTFWVVWKRGTTHDSA